MGLLDGILGQVAGNMDLKNLGEKVGLSPEQVEQAVAALGQAHPQPGDTVDTAAANTGIPPEVMQQIVEHLGGEGALGRFATAFAEQHAGGLLGGLGGLGGLFGKS